MTQADPVYFDRTDKELRAGALTAPVFLQAKGLGIIISLYYGCDSHRQACREIKERSG